MAQADPPREASPVRKMNERSLLLSLNEIAYYFKKWTSCKWCFERNLFPKTTTHPKNIMAISTLKEQVFGESGCSQCDQLFKPKLCQSDYKFMLDL